MRVNIQTEVVIPADGPNIGNVYPVKGGYGARDGLMMVLIAFSEGMATYLRINKEGEIVGAGSYGVSTFKDRVPIAYVEGVDEIELTMRSI